jgi:hypothetical protein
MPPHSSHILQPLNVGCFAALKKAYGSLVSDLMRLGINHIDKAEFLGCLESARLKAYSLSNIHSSFAATGIVPFEPDRVLSTLSRPITPPQQPPAQDEHYTPQTPHNLAELQRHGVAFRELLKRLSRSPPTPTNQAVRQLVKGCELSMQSAVLLIEENTRLRAANERQKRKRLLNRRQLSKAASLTVAEASQLIQSSQNCQIEPVHGGDAEVHLSREVAPVTVTPQITCYICRSSDHMASACIKYRIDC